MIISILLSLFLISPNTYASIGEEGDFPHELYGGVPTYYPVGHLQGRENNVSVDRVMKVKKKDTWKGIPVRDNMDIYRGDLIKTGDASLAEVKLNSGIVLKIGPRSVLRILDQENGAGRTNSNLDLWEGNLRETFLTNLSQINGELTTRISTKRTVVTIQGQSDIAVQYKDKDKRTVTVASFDGKASVSTTPEKTEGSNSQDEILSGEYMQTRIEKGENSISRHNVYKPTKILEQRKQEIIQGFTPTQEGAITWVYEIEAPSGCKKDADCPDKMVCEDHICKVPVSKILNKGDACPVAGKECDTGLICNYINAKHGTCTDPNIDEDSFYCKADNECKSNICKGNECSLTRYSEERGTNWLRFFLGMQAAYLEHYVPHTTFWSSQVGVMPTFRLLEYLHFEPYGDITFGSTNFSTTFFRVGGRFQLYVTRMIYTGAGVGLFWYNKYMSKGKRDLSFDVGYSFPLNYFVDSLRFTYINSKGSGKDQFAFSFGIVIGFGLGKRIEDER